MVIATGLLAVILLVILVNQSGEASDLNAALTKSKGQVSELSDRSETLDADLASAQQEISSADGRIAELEELVAAQELALVDAADAEETLTGDLNEVAGSLSDVKRSLTTARADKRRAEEQIASLLITYSEDIDAALETLAAGAVAFACDWGTSQAVDGKAADSIDGGAAVRAFKSSDALATLREAPAISTALDIAETLGEDPYAANSDEIEATAIGCWQKEDSKINAALYEHQSVFREAVLDAACTQGAENVFDGYYSGFSETAIYRAWELKLGDDAASEYRNSVVDQFGSIESFVAIPAETIEAESDRCEDIRHLISPKGEGTWNVGDEIKPGTWKAYDESDCYWARLSDNGDIRDNHFGDALRISVNVQASDGQFEISNCRRFYYANP
jgi:hypothetical protein